MNFENLFVMQSDSRFVGRFDLEGLDDALKAEWVLGFIASFGFVSQVVYQILFWENNQKTLEVINSLVGVDEYVFARPYDNTETPGIIYVYAQHMSLVFFRGLLSHHFNYEMAIEPSLNMKLKIILKSKAGIILLDIYDDRGFKLYYHPTSLS